MKQLLLIFTKEFWNSPFWKIVLVVLILMLFSFLFGKYSNGAGIPVCPEWDQSLLPEECRLTSSFNCLPRCGKYPGDKPDIGAYEWFPGITSEKPWGDWNGVPLDYNPLEGLDSPKNFRIDAESS